MSIFNLAVWFIAMNMVMGCQCAPSNSSTNKTQPKTTAPAKSASTTKPVQTKVTTRTPNTTTPTPTTTTMGPKTERPEDVFLPLDNLVNASTTIFARGIVVAHEDRDEDKLIGDYLKLFGYNSSDYKDGTHKETDHLHIPKFIFPKTTVTTTTTVRPKKQTTRRHKKHRTTTTTVKPNAGVRKHIFPLCILLSVLINFYLF